MNRFNKRAPPRAQKPPIEVLPPAMLAECRAELERRMQLGAPGGRPGRPKKIDLYARQVEP